MKINSFFFLLISSLLFVACNSTKPVFNSELKGRLDEIMYLDQTYRELFDNNLSAERHAEILKALKITDEQSRNWKIVADQDAKNLIQVEKIIAEYGYPGKSLVGEPTNKAAWYVIQHADEAVIAKYLPLIKKAATTGEIDFISYAMMLDRHLSYVGKPQIYGSQGFGGYWINEKTGKEEWIDFVWPIENPTKVNELRKKAGFTQTLEENFREIYGENFKVEHIPLETALKIKNYKKKWN